MNRIDAVLGGDDVTIWHGQPDPAAFQALFPAGQLYGIDVETTALTKAAQFAPGFRVRTVQVGTVGYAWVLDISDHVSAGLLVELLTDEQTSFCSHTDMDVMSIWKWSGIDISSRNTDTRLLARLVDAEKSTQNDLKSLTTRYLGPELELAESAMHEHFRNDLWEGKHNAAAALVDAHGWNTVALDEPSFVLYAGLDAVACRRLLPVLEALHGAPEGLTATEQWLSAESDRMREHGMRVDVEALDALRTEAVTACDAAAVIIAEQTGGILPTSPKIQPWLAEHGVDWDRWPGDRTPTGNPSLAKRNLDHLDGYQLDQAGRAVFDALKRHRAHQDIRNKTKGVTDVLVDGRIHPSLHTIGAVTGRMSSSGPNVQNFSKTEPRLRGLLLPDPGNVLITCDFAQIELRVVAALADERKMIDVIMAGGDLHQLTVDELEAVDVHISRDLGKMANFLIVYGGGGKALCEQSGIPRPNADAVVAAHRERYGAIADFSQMLANITTDLRTMSGRRIQVPQGRSYANVNYIVQSDSRELIVYAWQRFDALATSGRVWYPIHDELVIECPEADAEEVCKAAEQAMGFDFLGVPITAEAKVCRDEHGVSRWTK